MNSNKNKFFLYDLDLPLEERRQQAHNNPFDSALKIARILGVHPARIYQNAADGNRVYCKSKKKWYAVRQRSENAKH